jgi:tetratricopeptide (TPR) repeat protein
MRFYYMNTSFMRLAVFFAFTAMVAASCEPNYKKSIARLEQALEPAFRPGTVDSLIQAYQTAAAQAPTDHPACLSWLTKGAVLSYEKKQDAGTAVDMLETALGTHSAGFPLADQMGLAARIWHGIASAASATTRMQPTQATLLDTLMSRHRPWVDSALIQLESRMGFPLITDNKEAMRFIETAEGYAHWGKSRNLDKSIDLYLLAAGVAKTIGQPNKALQLYLIVSDQYPNHRRAPTALFMMGHIYEADLQDLDRAKSAYEAFLKRYPKDPDYVDDARYALKHLGKSPEELIAEFEKMNRGAE